MALDDRTFRSRRSLLAAALGAGAATVASAIGRPELVRAGSDGDVVLGDLNPGSATTTILVQTNVGAAAFKGEQLVGPGVHGVSQSGPGVLGEGVVGTTQPGVLGISYYTGPGVVGWSEQGPSGTATPTEYPLSTGVFGGTSIDTPFGRGVHGKATAGQGVRGEATTGTGVYATASTGTALQVSGKAAFSRSGRVSIGSGKSYVDVTVAGGLGGTPLTFANLMTYRAGVYVAAVRPNYPSTGKLRIYLNKALTTSTYAAWIVIG